jgi:hypothetical protein
MFLRPFEHQRQCAPTQMPLENLQRAAVNPPRHAARDDVQATSIRHPASRRATCDRAQLYATGVSR